MNDMSAVPAAVPTAVPSVAARDDDAAGMPGVLVVDHPLVQHKVTLVRSEETTTDNFRRLVREISQLLTYEATRDLAMETIAIRTPIAPTQSRVLSGKKLCLVSILRAGNGFIDGMLELLPAARVGHIGLYRDPRRWSRSSTTSRCPKISTSAWSSWWIRCWPPAIPPLPR